MASRVAFRLQQLLKHPQNWKKNPIGSILNRSYCSAISQYDDKDPAPLFFDDKVQGILKRLTGMNLEKVFRMRKNEEKLEAPRYEFMTDEQLQEYMAKAQEKADKLLQMPPVLKVRDPIDDVLSADPALMDYDTSKHIFTDITQGIPDRYRPIVVRETNGMLRRASWEERDRINQIYNPRPGRRSYKPQMFEDECLKDVIEREKYEFILNRACIQFEPDDPEYQRVCCLTYDAIDDKRNHELLHSTRHYGPMCFYLAWNKKIDNLLIGYIQKEQLTEGVDLIHLYASLHQDCKSVARNIDPSEQLELIKAYTEEDSFRRPQLQLAIQQYENLLYEREQYMETVKKSQGL